MSSEAKAYAEGYMTAIMNERAKARAKATIARNRRLLQSIRLQEHEARNMNEARNNRLKLGATMREIAMDALAFGTEDMN